MSDETDSQPQHHSEQAAVKSERASNVPPKSRKPFLAGASLVVIALAIGGGLYWESLHPRASHQSVVVTPSVLPSVSPDAKAAVLQRFSKPTTGETWLTGPQKLSPQGYLKDEATIDTTYYQVGQHGSAKIVMSVMSEIGDFILLYEVTPDGKATAILHPDGQAVYNVAEDTGVKEQLAPGITANATTHYDSLTLPTSLDVGQGYVVGKPVYNGLGNFILPGANANIQSTTIKSYGKNTLVRQETKYVDTKLTSIGYSLITPMNTRITMTYEPLESHLENYQWAAGTSTSDTISPITRGCGGATTSVSRSDIITSADVQVAGKSPSGTTVYALLSLDNPLMTKAYDEFNSFYAGMDKSQNSNIGISKAEFALRHGVILMHDNFGQWLVFARDQLRPQGGCAKPVIYLYPTTTQLVNVRVGASVKVSEPTYEPSTGWNALAQPDGSLSVAGFSYDSLFWEGPGIGPYPGISAGTVVARSAAASVIRNQLAQQGLVGHEINDFMAYWESRLPNKPYLRLTWFNTTQMNQLAPLAISPRPNTLIRVFLDADGLDSPIALPAQHLTSVPRSGFTVVEWGGLATSPLHK